MSDESDESDESETEILRTTIAPEIEIAAVLYRGEYLRGVRFQLHHGDARHDIDVHAANALLAMSRANQGDE